MQKIAPFLWFDGQAQEAADFYVSIFKNSRIVDAKRYGEAGPGKKGSVMSVTFELDGQRFIALNGGPQFKFSPAISFFISCQNQQEVDELWDKLSAGGQTRQCGWLTDKFGVTWQIVPSALGEMLGDKNPTKVKNVMQAMFQMVKLDAARLRQAYDQE
jgi:predicted 3-demethylubiquinone-9 3-methyltransferase (glyoxalase superfamily)